MVNKKIKFGTDGWRGIIADDFTVADVKAVTQGVCNYLKKKADGKGRGPRVAIGYDTRFGSDRFAGAAAGVFSGNGITTWLSDRFIPTPVLSTAVVKKKADLGIMITASHNPYHYNGYKIKGPFGGSATVDMISDIEEEVNGAIKNINKYEKYLNGGSVKNENIEEVDFTGIYRRHVDSIIDRDAIEGFSVKLLFDPMYGASQDIFASILDSYGPGNIKTIHAMLNPAFGGINPEPIGDNLNEAISILKKEKYELGICLDGDGDRIGALGEDGNYISSHHIFAMVLWYLAARKKIKARVIKTVTTSSIIDRICSGFGLELITTPVGFKYIGEKILEGGVMVGGEESGGLWVQGNIPERDGIVMGLRMLEIICSEGKTANQILKNIYDQFGYFVYDRKDYRIDADQKERLKSLLSAGIPGPIQKAGADSVVTIDGFKYIIDDHNWIMIRPSGTEAVVRIYAEGEDEERTGQLQALGRKVLESAI